MRKLLGLLNFKFCPGLPGRARLNDFTGLTGVARGLDVPHPCSRACRVCRNWLGLWQCLQAALQRPAPSFPGTELKG